jgi:redox-sensitive bicupin YhaK (pirin superfamily)
MKIRSAGIVMDPKEADEAEGVTIRRTIGGERLVLLDPFLLLDHLSIEGLEGETKVVGFPRHPHRGIETLTYLFAGWVNHRDSLGNDSKVGANGSQWMTAGGGIFHEEMFEADSAGGEGLQIWFNLPAAQKLKSPGYRPAHATDIPEVALEGGATARVVAGELGGKRGAFAGIAVDPTYLDVRLPAGATVTLPAAQGETAFAYLYRGQAHCGPTDDRQEATAPQLVIFCDGDAAQITATAESPGGEARFIFVSARPLREPVLQYRSLVMNTVEEMQQAIADLKNGTFEAH